MPPTLGHRFLVDFARQFCDSLVIMLHGSPDDPITLRTRREWLTREFGGVATVVVNTDVPQPELLDHPDFFSAWGASVLKFMPDHQPPQVICASNIDAQQLSGTLGCRFIPVDIARSALNVSASQVLLDPMRHWEMILPCARPYFLKRVAIVGPECSGKTVLAQRLALHFNTSWVPEWAAGFRELMAKRWDELSMEDIELIARGQRASEKALAMQANRILFSDTDVCTLELLSAMRWNQPSPTLRRMSGTHKADLYIVANPATPWKNDPEGSPPDLAPRSEFFQNLLQHLERKGLSFTIVEGNWNQRYQAGIAAVDLLMGNTRREAPLPGPLVR